VQLGKLESLADALAAAPAGVRFRRTLAGAIVTLDRARITIDRAPARRNRVPAANPAPRVALKGKKARIGAD
jgi:hypothetical protein